MKVKIFRLLSAVVLVFALVIVSVASANAVERIVDENIDKLNFEQSLLAQEVDAFVRGKYGGSYPSYFGGVYVSDDSRNVVVQIVEDNIPENRLIYEQIVGMGSAIRVEYVDNSYEELNDVNERIIAYFESEKAAYKNLSANYVDIINNDVVVQLLDDGQEQKDSFERLVVDSDLIVFTQGENTDYVNLKAGQQISGSSGLCSMGYRVKVGGKAGYITSAHCVAGLNSTIPTGTVKKYQRSGKVEAAFVQTTSSYTPLNSLAYTSGIINSLDSVARPTLVVNTGIAKSGRTTGYTSGQVKSLNYSGNFGGVYLTNLVATTANADHGDSGAPVFTTSLAAGGAPLAGVLLGGALNNSNARMIFVNESNVRAAFGYARY